VAAQSCDECGECTPEDIAHDTMRALGSSPRDPMACGEDSGLDAGGTTPDAGVDSAVPFADGGTEAVDAESDATKGDAGDGGGGDPPACAADGALEAGPIDCEGRATTSGECAQLRLAALSDACLSLLHLDDGPWNPGETVLDSSGSGHSGSARLGSVTSTEGVFGSAAYFDGETHVRIPDHPDFGAMQALTVALWFRIDPDIPTDAYYPGLIAKRIGYSVDSVFTIHLNPGDANEVAIDVGPEVDSRFHSIGTVRADGWHHVAFVFDGSQPEAE